MREVLYWTIPPLLFGVCFGALAFVLLRALREGADAYGKVYAADAARQLDEIFLFIPPDRVVDIARGLAITFFILSFLLFGDLSTPRGIFGGTAIGLVAAFAALNAPRVILHALKQRRLERFNQQLVDALLTMSNALRAGFSILQSFESVVKERQNPIAQEYGVFLQQTRVGVRFEDALRQMEERVGSEDLTLMIRSIETARQTGGNLTEVFDKIASTIRERNRIRGRIRSLTAQGRLQGIVVGAMPVLLVVAMTALDPAMMIGFMTSAAGIGIMVFAGLLEVVGALIIRKIIRIQV